MLQVQLFLHVQRLTVMTPMGLMGHATWNTSELQPFNRKDCFAFTVPELQFQLRMHDFYMGELFTFIAINILTFHLEMSLNLDVVTGGFRNDHPVKSSTHSSNLIQEEVLKIDGLFHLLEIVVNSHGIMKVSISRPIVCSVLSPGL